MGTQLTIDTKSYPLSNANYYEVESSKLQIIVGHTFNTNMNHYHGWVTRLGGTYKGTAAFTIDTNGKVYQHYDSKYYSDFIAKDGVNLKAIAITLVNQGWVEKIEDTNQFINAIGQEYLNDDIIERKWRNQRYWTPYSKKQLTSLIKLSKHLCEKHDIYLRTIGYNTKVDSISDYGGVVFRSNFLKDYTDLSPAFDFSEFKNKLEK